MASWQELIERQIEGGAVAVTDSKPPRIARYAETLAEYRALDAGPALVDRCDRALLQITGKDRATWLHNLTTHEVKNLHVGEGNYAFVLNVQGRILFDANILVRAESMWIDLDRQFLDPAKKHFARYIITEDVTVTDRTGDFVRLALVGQAAARVLSSLGASNAAAMAQLSQATIEWTGAAAPAGSSTSVAVVIVRHDFCGPFAVELFVPREAAVEVWTSLRNQHHAIPVGEGAVQIRRIEAGMPWPGCEITSEYLPAETRQLDRAVSYQKGCYLGQEVVERMRSRHVVARQLVGLRLDGSAAVDLKSQILDAEGKPAGLVTSACHSPWLDQPIALGYVKTALSAVGSRMTVGATPAIVEGLPFRPAA